MRVIGCIVALMMAPWCLGGSPLTEEEAAPLIPFDEASEHINEYCYVQGRIVLAKSIGTMCFLNFHPDFRNQLTAVIPKEHLDKFPESPETMYLNKHVKIFGRVIEYGGKPEIVVTSPAQITILADDAPAPPARARSTQPASSPFAGTVKLATFNVLNLFDGEDDPYHEDEGTPAKPRDQLAKLAKTLRAVNADVVALEEVENRFYLGRFVRALLPDMGYTEVVLVEGNYYRGADVAVLSRLPVGPVITYRHLKFPDAEGRTISFQRDLLRVRIEPPGLQPFDMMVVHLKSKSGGEKETASVRLGEARQVRRIVDDILAGDPGARFVLCGDFNDTLESETLKTVLGSGAQALPTFVEDIPEAARVSFNEEPHRSLIDFILFSPALSRGYQKGSGRILPCSVAECGSDHNPVMATIDLR